MSKQKIHDCRPICIGSLKSDLQLRSACALMRFAREQGHRLSDVVGHASEHLASAKLTNAFAYIRALIQRPTDYAYLSKQRDERKRQESELVERKRAREELDTQLRAYAGTTFESADGTL